MTWLACMFGVARVLRSGVFAVLKFIAACTQIPYVFIEQVRDAVRKDDGYWRRYVRVRMHLL